MGTFPHEAGEIDSAPFDNYIDIVALASEETVAHIASDHEGTHALFSGDITYYMENLPPKKLGSNGGHIVIGTRKNGQALPGYKN